LQLQLIEHQFATYSKNGHVLNVFFKVIVRIHHFLKINSEIFNNIGDVL